MAHKPKISDDTSMLPALILDKERFRTNPKLSVEASRHFKYRVFEKSDVQTSNRWILYAQHIEPFEPFIYYDSSCRVGDEKHVVAGSATYFNLNPVRFKRNKPGAVTLAGVADVISNKTSVAPKPRENVEINPQEFVVGHGNAKEETYVLGSESVDIPYGYNLHEVERDVFSGDFNEKFPPDVDASYIAAFRSWPSDKKTEPYEL